MNLEVSLGMTVSQMLERCGLVDKPTHIVTGGPMTGRLVSSPEQTVITPTTRAVLAFHQNRRNFYSACVGCGRCERVCPVGLNPAHICRLVQNNFYPMLKQFDAHLCVGCGTCSYICPSRLDIVGTTLRAKAYAATHFADVEGGEEEDGDN